MPGHTRGTQVVVVETGGRPVVICGDVAVWFGELDEPRTEGQLRNYRGSPCVLAHGASVDNAVLPGNGSLAMSDERWRDLASGQTVET